MRVIFTSAITLRRVHILTKTTSSTSIQADTPYLSFKYSFRSNSIRIDGYILHLVITSKD